jgi:mannitol-specific phosphotransferase system IIBC component
MVSLYVNVTMSTLVYLLYANKNLKTESKKEREKGKEARKEEKKERKKKERKKKENIQPGLL